MASLCTACTSVLTLPPPQVASMEMIYKWSGDPCPPRAKTSEKEEETPKNYIKAVAFLNGT